MHIEMKQEVWWVQSLIKVCVVIYYMTQGDLHAPAALQKLLTLWLLNYQN